MGPDQHVLGADDGIRTRDPNLGKVVLYQLSHVRVWVRNLTNLCPGPENRGRTRAEVLPAPHHWGASTLRVFPSNAHTRAHRAPQPA